MNKETCVDETNELKERACEDKPVVDATETSCPSNEVDIQTSENDDTQREKVEPPKSTNSKIVENMNSSHYLLYFISSFHSKLFFNNY